MGMIADHLKGIQQKILHACVVSSRAVDEITLVAMSKAQTVDALQEAYGLGLRHFGENYVQEWLLKREQCAHLKDITWHFTGHLQTNKIKQLYPPHQPPVWLHSLDRLSLLVALAKRAQEIHQIFPILIQLCVDPEDSGKVSGASYETARNLCQTIAHFPQIRLKGFMGMGPDTEDTLKLEHLYANFVQNAESLWVEYVGVKETPKPLLSLGMSNDLAIAIAAGSTMLRVGRGVFGERELKA